MTFNGKHLQKVIDNTDVSKQNVTTQSIPSSALKTQLQSAANQTKLLLAEKQRVATIPHNDPEFKRSV